MNIRNEGNLFLQINYIDEIQMSFLRLLHTRASQKFTYFCINSVGWYNTETKKLHDALFFMGDNEYEFKGTNLRQKDVPFDGCRVSWQTI